jgi:hypothetical protein
VSHQLKSRFGGSISTVNPLNLAVQSNPLVPLPSHIASGTAVQVTQPSNHFDSIVTTKNAASQAAAVGIASSPILVFPTPPVIIDSSGQPRDLAKTNSDRLCVNRLRSGIPVDSGGDDSIPSSSSPDENFPQAFNDDEHSDEELPTSAYGIHSDLFENYFTSQLSAVSSLYRAPDSIIATSTGQVFGP